MKKKETDSLEEKSKPVISEEPTSKVEVEVEASSTSASGEEKLEKPLKAGIVRVSGRRKRAVARLWLKEGKGDFTVNGRSINDYFPKEEERLVWNKPFHSVGISHPASRFTATIKVEGGGKTAQLNAVALASARALIEVDPEWQPILSKQNLLSRDPREKERKKYYLRGARKRPQFSKR